MTLAIRAAEPADASRVVELIQELAANSGETSPISLAYAQEYLRSPENHHILLAEQDGITLGLLSYSIRSDLFHAAPTVLIEELVVRPLARGQGVGSALMETLLQRVRSQGCAEVSVSTMPDNSGAIRFYNRHGLTDESVFLEKHF